MRKTFSYKAIINKTTEANALQWFDLCHTLYNIALEQRILYWEQYRKSLSAYDQMYQLPDLKKAFPQFWFVDAQVLTDVIKRLDRAYKYFFNMIKHKKKAGLPHFKYQKEYRSFTLHQKSWKLIGKYLYVRNVGTFKLFISRHVEGDIKTITIKQERNGNWFVYFSCDNVPNRILPKTGKSIGIDLGIRNYLVTSEGKVIANPRFYQSGEKLLACHQRRLDKKDMRSKRREKERMLVAISHTKIANQRKDFHYKLANDLVNKYDTIYVENLDLEPLINSRFTSKQTYDASWSSFLKILKDKAKETGRTVIEVNSADTSLICSNCGRIRTKNKMAIMYHCNHCGHRLDRDHNAAINILGVGQTLHGGAGLPASVK